MISLKLTEKEVKALSMLISDRKPCSSGCEYHPNEYYDCSKCEYTKCIESIVGKLSES